MAGASIPLQPLPDGAWQVTAQVEIPLAAAYHQAGLVLYQDGSNYAKVDIEWSGNGTLRAEFIKRTAGKDSTPQTVIPSIGSKFWVRLISDGVSVTAQYSLNGSQFLNLDPVVALSASFSPIGIGPFAMQGTTGVEEIKASFAWVQFAPDADELAACLVEPAAFIALTGPQTASVGAASADFTVTPDGSFTGTLTPVATGGTGTFTPASLTWAGSAAPQTFTFTPDGPGTVTVTLAGLTDQALDPEEGVAVEVAGAAASLALSAQVSTKCMAGKAYLSVKAFNDNDVPVELTITTSYGAKVFVSIAANKSGLQAFTTKALAYPSGSVQVAAAAVGDSTLTGQESVAYPGGVCG
jgi:regulation of enolase protein 1 (concanavalin A-like superfamily)